MPLTVTVVVAVPTVTFLFVVGSVETQTPPCAAPRYIVYGGVERTANAPMRPATAWKNE